MTPALPPPDPATSKRALDVVQTLASVAGSLAIVWAFLEKIAKPYHESRKRRQAEIIREVLHDELKRLDGICDREEQIVQDQQLGLARQEEIFKDLDYLIEIASDNRDRLNEINELMDEVGLSSRDRRAEHEEEMSVMFDRLVERRKQRRRRLPVHDPATPPEA